MSAGARTDLRRNAPCISKMVRHDIMLFSMSEPESLLWLAHGKRDDVMEYRFGFSMEMKQDISYQIFHSDMTSCRFK